MADSESDNDTAIESEDMPDLASVSDNDQPILHHAGTGQFSIHGPVEFVATDDDNNETIPSLVSTDDSDHYDSEDDNISGRGLQ